MAEEQVLPTGILKRLDVAEALAREQLERARNLTSMVKTTGGAEPEIIIALAQLIATNYDTVVMNAKVVK